MRITKKYLDDLTFEIIGSAIEVHKIMGCALKEKSYQKCMAREFDIRGIKYYSEKHIELNYKGMVLGEPQRCDFLVTNQIVVELKTVKQLIDIHEAQLLSYMSLLKKPKGILINFHIRNIAYEGQKTYVNEYFRDLPDF
ncbi:MAG: GxxExxY protein [Bacteroidota bacterium]